MAECQSCQAKIKFIKTKKNGKYMPVDAKETTVITKEGEIIKGHIPHWVTCDNPDKFRK